MRISLRSLSYNAALAAGLFMAAAACTYVPFTVERVREGDNLSAPAGYSFIWAPPDNVTACKEVFGSSNSGRLCKVRPNTPPIALAVLAIAFLTAGLLSLIGLPQKSRN